MPRKFLIGAAVAAIAGAAFMTPALSQVSFEFGVGAPRYYEPAPRYRAYDRDYYRPAYNGRRVIVDDDDECRVVERRRINRFGEIVIRRERICD